MKDLGSITGFPALASATDINVAGQVVGTNNGRAFIWTADNGMRDLNKLVPPGTRLLSEAVGINDEGQIVARSLDNELVLSYVLHPISR
jgi:probable HAF family extracellular repeat protein